jgi:hypothetical protein
MATRGLAPPTKFTLVHSFDGYSTNAVALVRTERYGG